MVSCVINFTYSSILKSCDLIFALSNWKNTQDIFVAYLCVHVHANVAKSNGIVDMISYYHVFMQIRAFVTIWFYTFLSGLCRWSRSLSVIIRYLCTAYQVLCMFFSVKKLHCLCIDCCVRRVTEPIESWLMDRFRLSPGEIITWQNMCIWRRMVDRPAGGRSDYQTDTCRAHVCQFNTLCDASQTTHTHTRTHTVLNIIVPDARTHSIMIIHREPSDMRASVCEGRSLRAYVSRSSYCIC